MGNRASVGPCIMGQVLTGGQSWNMGYRAISFLQIGLTVLLFVSLPLWRKKAAGAELEAEQGKETKNITAGDSGAKTGSAADDSRDSLPAESGRPLSLRDIVRIPGAKEMMVSFFCYSMVEQTTSLWAGSYLVLHKGMSAESAAGFAGLFFIGITVGRFFSGFFTMKFSDSQMIRLGQAIILLGIVALLLPVGNLAALSGLLLLGLGCAPIYPSIIHSTPENFGRNNSQAVMGVQMAFAYVGTCLMPPVFGLIANGVSVSLFPLYLLLGLVVMVLMHEKMLLKKSAGLAGKRAVSN